MNPNPVLNNFLDKKKAESAFVSLEDGESIVIKRLVDMKLVSKLGFDGKEKDVIRLMCEVETSEGLRTKSFDNGTQRFVKEMQEKGVTIGSSFVLTRTGLQTKTRYILSQVVTPSTPSTAPAAPAPTASAEPQLDMDGNVVKNGTAFVPQG